MEIELMTQQEIDAALGEWAAHQARLERREKRNRWMRTWGLAILAGVLVCEVLALGHMAGAW